MRISDYIRGLEAIRAVHGDLKVYARDTSGFFDELSHFLEPGRIHDDATGRGGEVIDVFAVRIEP